MRVCIAFKSHDYLKSHVYVITILSSYARNILHHIVVSESARCVNGSESTTGLWVDVLAFLTVTIQIVILDSEYADQIQKELQKSKNCSQRY